MSSKRSTSGVRSASIRTSRSTVPSSPPGLGRGAGADTAGQPRPGLGRVRDRRGRAAGRVRRTRQGLRTRSHAGRRRLDLVERPGFKVFWNAPAVVLLCARRGNPEAPFDCCRAAQNLQLAAHARGLGTCWVGAPMPWLGSAGIAEEPGLPAGLRSVGRAAARPSGRAAGRRAARAAGDPLAVNAAWRSATATVAADDAAASRPPCAALPRRRSRPDPAASARRFRAPVSRPRRRRRHR